MEFYINGQQVESPQGWDETRASRDFIHDTQLSQLTYDQEYTWGGSVYSLIYGFYKTGNICDLLNVEVRLRGRTIVRGVIFVTDCVFNESLHIVRVKIRDEGFSARIQNNLSVPITIFGSESKNGVTITPITPLAVNMFTQATGGPLVSVTVRSLYSVHDAMKFCVDWMTDGNVGFRSDFFDTGIGAADFVTSGANLREANGADTLGPTISFRDLFSTWRALRNVAIGFERSNGQPIVRVEHVSYFQEGTGTPVQCQNADSVEMDFVQELLYSFIDIGSDVTLNSDCSGSCGAFVNTRWYGFNREGFSIGGTCNIDQPYALFQQNKVVIDGNTIQSILIDGEDQYDDSLICVHVDTSIPIATAGDPLNIGQYWYNVPYTNAEVIARYTDYLNGNVETYSLATDLNLFLCSGSSPFGRFAPSVDYTQTLASFPAYTSFPNGGGPVVWANDTAFIQAVGSVVPRIAAGFTSFDTGSRYDDTTGRYTVEFDGALRFESMFSVQAASGSAGGTINVRLVMERYDSGGTLISTTNLPALNDTVFNLTVFTPTNLVDTGFVEVNAGDYFQFRIEATTTNPFSTSLQVFDGWIELVESRSVVRIQQTNSGSKRLGVRRTFTYPLDDAATDTLLNDTTKKVRVTGRATEATGFVEKLDVNLYDNTATISIISNG